MDLVNYIQNYLRAHTGGSNVAVPGRALQPTSGPPIIDTTGYEIHRLPNFAKDRGFGPGLSEVPKALEGPATKAIARRAMGAAGGGLFDAALGPIGAMIGLGDGRPDNSAADMQGLTDAYKQARMAKQIQPTQNMPPVQPLDDAPQRGLPQLPWWASGDMTKMIPGASPATSPVPMPQPRPPQANPGGPIPGAVGPTSVGGAPLVNPPQSAPPPSQPDTSFFMRNALMMHDPSTGQLIDPQGAASVTGPDLISKMMTYLHNK